jgi:hypothetical protein
MAIAEEGNEAANGASAGLADDVANEQNFHGANTGECGA